MQINTPDESSEEILDTENKNSETIPNTDLAKAETAPEEVDAITSQTSAVYKGAGVRWGLLGGLLLVVLIIVLAAQNTNSVDFTFLTWKVTAPLSAIILGSAVIAVVIDELAGWVWGIRRRRQLRRKAELKQLKAETEPPKTKRFGRS